MPAAAHTEKDGSFTNTQRLLQWHHKAVEPKGDCRVGALVLLPPRPAAHESLKDSKEQRDELLLHSRGTTRRRAIARARRRGRAAEINGSEVATGAPLDAYTKLKDDGSTACGCWIYCGVYKDGDNQAARRKPHWEQN